MCECGVLVLIYEGVQILQFTILSGDMMILFAINAMFFLFLKYGDVDTALHKCGVILKKVIIFLDFAT